MKKKCLACGKEWVEGLSDDGLVSHGVCEGYCSAILELWTYNPRGMTLKDFYKSKQEGSKGDA